jgi:DNA-binding beta-propeller fold protein YncE
MTDSEQQLSGMSRRQSLQLGAISMLGLLTAGATQPAQAASPATATGNGAMTGDGHKLVPDQGVRVTERPKNYITPKGLKVDREIVNISDLKFNLNGYDLGDRILVMPQKMGGGVNLLDLGTGRALASLWYWNYGDYNPISHHIQAFPSKNPYQEFEFINSCQGGMNSLIYGMPTSVTDPPPGFNMYRVRFNGDVMELEENISETTGLGLGVHTTIRPSDAKSYCISDGQKDIFAWFDRASTKVLQAFRYDWEGSSSDLADCWTGGGVLKIQRIKPNPQTDQFDLRGTKGIKINWEMVPMGELFVPEGKIPGPNVRALTGADAFVWHPSGKWGAEIIRMLGGCVIHDVENGMTPVAYCAFPSESPDTYPVEQIDDDTWQVVIDKVYSPGHELGFSPDGNHLVMMNNGLENSVGIFDSSDPDPSQWTKIKQIIDPTWGKRYPSPFHMAFTPDSKKMYLVVLNPAPGRSGIMVVDTATWTPIKELQNITQDMQSCTVTPDGKFLLVAVGGFQRYASGVFVLDVENDEPVGFVPNPGGHHDLTLVPTSVDQLRFSRSCAM